MKAIISTYRILKRFNTLCFFCSWSILIFISCTNNSDKKSHDIINNSVLAHGGDNYKNLAVGFDFRNFKIQIKLDNTNFSYSRINQDSLNNEIKDVLNQDGFERFKNGKTTKLIPKDFEKYKESTNSIAYFALLPYKLQDQAVISEYLGSTQINGILLDKVKIKFKTEGGGKDHDDVYCYWFNTKTYTLDYLAYDNGGPRFRKALNRQKAGGVIFQDYENYEILYTNISTSEYDTAFLSGKARLLSKIQQTNYINLK